MDRDIVIIGAGMAGLACARRLAAAGHTPLVLDKGRGIGGRMATRRVDLPEVPIRFDHGAQYLTVRDAGFAAAMAALGAACARWMTDAGKDKLVGVPGMSSLPRAMAAGLDVRTGMAVAAVQAVAGGWQVTAGDLMVTTQQLVMAVPAPQAAQLLGSAHALHSRLADVAMAPCLTLMAAFAGDTPRPFTTRSADDHPLTWIAQDSSKPGRSDAVTAWVAQASADWSARHIEDTADTIAQHMLPMLAEAIGSQPQAAIHVAAHRWRYARVVQPLGVPCLTSDDGSLHVGGDWCLGDRVEDAWRSGTAMAEALLTR